MFQSGALRHVTMPMAAAGIAAALIIACLMAWNELLFAMIPVGGSAVALRVMAGESAPARRTSTPVGIALVLGAENAVHRGGELSGLNLV